MKVPLPRALLSEGKTRPMIKLVPQLTAVATAEAEERA